MNFGKGRADNNGLVHCRRALRARFKDWGSGASSESTPTLIFRSMPSSRRLGKRLLVAWHFDAANQRRQFLIRGAAFYLGLGSQLHPMP